VVTESYDEVGYNYRMTDVQAAIGLVQLQRLDKMLARRRRLASSYSQFLTGVDWLVPPFEPAECRHNFQSYMIWLKNNAPLTRDQLMQELLDRGVSSRRGIMAIHRERPYRKGNWDVRLPMTSSITDNTIVLPIFHEMTDDEQTYVIECIEQINVLTTK
jgi:dTDP-4-amino-4,6-dideoxygalactose transaminase